MAVVVWKLHEEMGKRRMRIRDVARAAGLSWETVGAIYHGRAKFVSLETLDKLCRALGCQPGDLMVYVPDEE